MRDLTRWCLAIVLVMLVPIVPFIGFGDRLEAGVERWFDESLSKPATAGIVILVLSSDVLLPVPSSFVSTLAGSRLGLWAGAATVWLGMTAGAVGGFALARWFGRPLAERFAKADDLARMQALSDRAGPSVLVITRALPVLAEASVLLLGAMRLPWRRFLPAVVLSNLGLALAYAALGHYAYQHGSLPVALVASIALPVLATTLSRQLLPMA